LQQLFFNVLLSISKLSNKNTNNPIIKALGCCKL